MIVRSYIYAAGYVPLGEDQLEIELVRPLAQPPFPTKHNLVLEQGDEPVAIVSARLLRLPGSKGGIVHPVPLAGAVRGLVDLRVAMQTNDNVRHAERLDHLQHNAARDDISRAILPVRIVWLDVEVGDVTGLGAKGRLDAGEQGLLRRGRGRPASGTRGHRWHLGREHDAATRRELAPSAPARDGGGDKCLSPGEQWWSGSVQGPDGYTSWSASSGVVCGSAARCARRKRRVCGIRVCRGDRLNDRELDAWGCNSGEC